MKETRQNKFNTYALLFVVIAYLFIAVSHIFYLPQLTSGNATGPASSNSIFKRQNTDLIHQDMYFLQRTDKSTIDERKKILSDIAQLACVTFILLLACLFPVRSLHQFYPRNYTITNGQYTYLALCTFRI